MTTATYLPGTGFGQDVWNQSIQQYGPQPFGPIGGQGFGMPSMQPQAFQQQGWQQPFGLQTGQQILSVLPGLIAQQAQQLYAIAQVCSQLATRSGSRRTSSACHSRGSGRTRRATRRRT
jgi:hypothetical protein